MNIKIFLLTILEKFIITFEFLWATWWAWLVIVAGVLGVYRYFVTSQARYLFGILIIIMGAWHVFKGWQEYLEEYGKSK